MSVNSLESNGQETPDLKTHITENKIKLVSPGEFSLNTRKNNYIMNQ